MTYLAGQIVHNLGHKSLVDRSDHASILGGGVSKKYICGVKLVGRKARGACMI